jgi:hypothetical protein
MALRSVPGGPPMKPPGPLKDMTQQRQLKAWLGRTSTLARFAELTVVRAGS